MGRVKIADAVARLRSDTRHAFAGRHPFVWREIRI